MCLKIRTSYRDQEAVTVRAEQLPSIDWILHQKTLLEVEVTRERISSRHALVVFQLLPLNGV